MGEYCVHHIPRINAVYSISHEYELLTPSLMSKCCLLHLLRVNAVVSICREKMMCDGLLFVVTRAALVPFSHSHMS